MQLVDDGDNVLYVTRRSLTRYGYRVEAYSDPQRAPEAFHAMPDSHDVIVPDLMMPGLTGADLISSARFLRSGIPTVLVSSRFV